MSNGSRAGSTIQDVILEAIRARMVETHTALPGKVERFYPSDQTADVRIPLKRTKTSIEGVESTFEWPLLAHVPVWMPHAGAFHITLPVAVGDECLVLFLERDASKWLTSSFELAPETRRLHDVSDGIALIGLDSPQQKIASYNADDLEISNDAGTQSIILRANGDIEIASVKLSLGAGLEDVMIILSEITDLIAAMTVTGDLVAKTPTTTDAAALKARILAVTA